MADEARALARLTDRPFKVTLPAASRELAFWGRPVLGPEAYDAEIYADPDEALAALLAVEDATRHRDVSGPAISPQCGFASAVGLNDAADVQWRRIEVMCRVADRVWGR